MALGLAALGVWGLLGGFTWFAPAPGIGVAAALLIAAVLFVMDLARSRIVLHVDGIEQFGVFRARRLGIDDIESWRLFDTPYFPQVRLRTRPGRGRSMKIDLMFTPDAPWRAWFARLRSTDEEGRSAALARLLADDRLGMLPGDRLRILGVSQRFGRAATWVVFAAGLWAIYAGRHVEPVVAICLLLPVVAIWLAGSRRTLLTLQEPSRADIRVSLWMALFMGALAPLLAALKTLALASIVPLVAPAVVLGSLATAWALAADPTLRERKAAVVSVAVPLMLYGGALAVWLNHALPPLQRKDVVVVVTGAHVRHHGRGGSTFSVSLGPAPTSLQWRELDVPRSTWDRLPVGSLACLEERRGLLGATEATIRPCPVGAASHGSLPS